MLHRTTALNRLLSNSEGHYKVKFTKAWQSNLFTPFFCLLERKRQAYFLSPSSGKFACNAFSLPSHSALTGVSSGDNLKYAKSWIVILYLLFPKPELSALIFDFWEPILQNQRYVAWCESICLDFKGRNECYLFWTHQLKVQEAVIFQFRFSWPCYFSERMLRMGTA